MDAPSLNVMDKPSLPVMPTETLVVNRGLLQLFSFFLGTFGVDRFYGGDMVLGAIKLVTGGGFGIWAIVDIWIQMAEGVAGKTTTIFSKPFGILGKNLTIEPSSILAGQIIGGIYWFLLALAIASVIIFLINLTKIMKWLSKEDKASKSKSPDAAASDTMDMNIIGGDNVVPAQLF